MFRDVRFLGRDSVYYTNMFTGQEESITGMVGIRARLVGQLEVQFVVVLTQDGFLEIPDFCVAPKSQHLLRKGVA